MYASSESCMIAAKAAVIGHSLSCSWIESLLGKDTVSRRKAHRHLVINFTIGSILGLKFPSEE